MENQSQSKSVLSIQDWVITLVIAAIPMIGFIMLFVWGFGNGTNVIKANFASYWPNKMNATNINSAKVGTILKTR